MSPGRALALQRWGREPRAWAPLVGLGSPPGPRSTRPRALTPACLLPPGPRRPAPLPRAPSAPHLPDAARFRHGELLLLFGSLHRDFNDPRLGSGAPGGGIRGTTTPRRTLRALRHGGEMGCVGLAGCGRAASSRYHTGPPLRSLRDSRSRSGGAETARLGGGAG